ncbi:MAG: tetratricopeptide repeat protein [Woeseiaceae bacterium]|nr:tetratricopeptide repeat protein [Woeseiaceae bacterium]
MGAFEELKRRNVFRVAAAYVVVSWLIVQIADVFLGNIGAPDWVIQTLFLVLSIGLVFALVFSWAYEITPEGIRKESEVEHDASSKQIASRRLDYVTIVAAAGVAGMFVWQQLSQPGTTVISNGGADNTIAVLPFVNMSPQAENEYFSDGISEELLNTLVRVEGLQVASRTSAFSFKGRDVDIPTIAERLKVAHIVEGSVRRSGSQVRITAQLIDVRSDRHLWSESYTRELSDVFAIQDEIAAAIADSLELTLLGEEAGRRTDDIEAHDLYLLGRHEFHQRTPQSLLRAIDLFERAIAIDPEYALAYSGLADTFSLIVAYGDYDPQTALEAAESNARKAIELAPELAEAHASLGLSLAVQALGQDGIPHYQRAIELNPDYSMAHMWLGNAIREEPLSALAAFREAERVDPLHPLIAENIGQTLAWLGRFDEAEAHFDQALRDHPNTMILYYSRWQMEFERGRLDEAYRFARRAIAVDPNSPYALQAIAFSEMDIGNFDRAEAWIERFLAAAPEHNDQTWLRISLLESRQDYAAAIDYLESRRQIMSPLLHPFIDMNQGVMHNLMGNSEAALRSLEAVSEDQMGDMRYVFAVSQRALAQHDLGMQDDALATTDEAFEILQRLRDGGHAQGWLYDLEGALLAIRGDIDGAVNAVQTSFDLGWRNVYGFSAYWMLDRLIGDDPRYQEIRRMIYDDVRRMQQEINAEVEACRADSDACSLAAIDDV